MKGAYSSPEGVLDREIRSSLFTDTTYAVDSGGDPEVIPQLTYEQFLTSTESITTHPTVIFICMAIWIWKRN